MDARALQWLDGGQVRLPTQLCQRSGPSASKCTFERACNVPIWPSPAARMAEPHESVRVVEARSTGSIIGSVLATLLDALPSDAGLETGHVTTAGIRLRHGPG
jgi:hypothetical protein